VLIVAYAREVRHNDLMNREFSDWHYPDLVTELERFLGSAEIDRKLKRVDRSLKHANPLVAAYYGAPAKMAFWSGLRKARQALARRDHLSITDDDLRRALDLAATVRVLWPTMPEWKRADLKSQLLSENALEPVLLELKTALDLAISDHRLTWVEPSRRSGERTPDLIGEKDSFTFEVECKAQSADEGRKVARSAMHDFCYKLATAILGEKVRGVWRDVTVRVPDRFPANQTWQQDLVEKIAMIKNGGRVQIADGTYAEVVLRLSTNYLAAVQPRDFEHVCVLTVQPDGSEPALTIRCASMKPDRMLAAIEEDLTDALGQFSGARPGKIVCYVPEVSSFIGMNTLDSGIAQMTYLFFKSHRRARTVFEVDYVSDIGLTAGQSLGGGLHFLRFRNPNCAGQPPAAQALP